MKWLWQGLTLAAQDLDLYSPSFGENQVSSLALDQFFAKTASDGEDGSVSKLLGQLVTRQVLKSEVWQTKVQRKLKGNEL